MPGAYRELARRPHVPALFALGIVARLPVGMVPLAMLLSARAAGLDYGRAGVLVGAYTVGLAIGSPLAGRRLDRRGPVRVLRVRAILFAALLCVLALLVEIEGPFGLVAVVALGSGLSLPPVGSAIRSLWGAVVEGPQLQTAFSLEAAFQEVTFAIGPLLVAALALADPVAALGVAAAATLVGTLALTRLPPVVAEGRRQRVVEERSLLGALAAPGVRTIVAFAAGCGLAFGAMEVALPAFAEEHGSRTLAGVVLACFAAGSLVGGLVAGSRRVVDVTRRLRLAAACLVPAFAVPLLAPSVPVMCACIFVAGLPIAPAFAASYGILDRVALPGTVGEAFAWNSMGVVSGASLGTVLAGQLVDAFGPRAAIVLATGAVAGAVGAVAARPRSLVAPAAPPAAPR